MTCDACGPGDKKELRKVMIGRLPSGYPLSCHQLECGHGWHLPEYTPCDCPLRQQSDQVG